MTKSMANMGRLLRRHRGAAIAHRDRLATVVGACSLRYDFGDVNPWDVLLPMLDDAQLVDPMQLDRQIVGAGYPRRPFDVFTGEPTE